MKCNTHRVHNIQTGSFYYAASLLEPEWTSRLAIGGLVNQRRHFNYCRRCNHSEFSSNWLAIFMRFFLADKRACEQTRPQHFRFRFEQRMRACASRASYVDERQWRAGNNRDGEKGGKMATTRQRREQLVAARRSERTTSRGRRMGQMMSPGRQGVREDGTPPFNM